MLSSSPARTSPAGSSSTLALGGSHLRPQQGVSRPSIGQRYHNNAPPNNHQSTAPLTDPSSYHLSYNTPHHRRQYNNRNTGGSRSGGSAQAPSPGGIQLGVSSPGGRSNAASSATNTSATGAHYQSGGPQQALLDRPRGALTPEGGSATRRQAQPGAGPS